MCYQMTCIWFSIGANCIVDSLRHCTRDFYDYLDNVHVFNAQTARALIHILLWIQCVLFFSLVCFLFWFKWPIKIINWLKYSGRWNVSCFDRFKYNFQFLGLFFIPFNIFHIFFLYSFERLNGCRSFKEDFHFAKRNGIRKVNDEKQRSANSKWFY